MTLITHYEKIELPQLLELSKSLPHTGTLQQTESGLVYVDISDEFIHKLFPMLQKKYVNATKPHYFNKGGIGAHISVIYPAENCSLPDKEFGLPFHFMIYDLVRARISDKFYYVLLIKAPELITLRQHYELADKLNFKGYAIDLHITIANER